MNTETILAMAKKAGGSANEFNNILYNIAFSNDGLIRFAALIRNATIEECAEVCDNAEDDSPKNLNGYQCAAAIRQMRSEE